MPFTLGETISKGPSVASFDSEPEAKRFVNSFEVAVGTAAGLRGSRVQFVILPEVFPYVFISHSSKDKRMLVAIRTAFDDATIQADFLEDTKVGGPPSKEIARKVSEAKALFVFFTKNSCSGDTRDWIVFEMGVACERNLPVYSWRGPRPSRKIPRLAEQLTTYSSFKLSSKGLSKLRKEIRGVIRKLS